MKTVFSHGQYIRSTGLLEQFGEYVRPYGKRACLIGSKTALGIVSDRVTRELVRTGIALTPPLWYGGECSESNIQAMIGQIEADHPDFLLVAGGGKAIDTVKAVGYLLDLPVIAIPTIASTCAAATCITILYDDHGEYVEISRRSKPPELILLDTQVILEAPVRFLTSGIGDTLAKWIEAKASNRKAQPNAFSNSAVALARYVYELLITEGQAAAEAIRQGLVSKELENIIDAIIPISGSISNYGGDDCRTAAAHAVYSGLTIFPETHAIFHGEIVAFGILTQLALEERPDAEFFELMAYYKRVNLPYTLAGLGIDSTLISDEQWQSLGSLTVEIEDMANMPFAVTPQMVIDAIRRADQLGRTFILDP